MKRKAISFLTVLAMLLSFLPVTATAVNNPEAAVPEVTLRQETVDAAQGIYKLVAHIHSQRGVKTLQSAISFDNTVIQPVAKTESHADVTYTDGDTSSASGSPIAASTRRLLKYYDADAENDVTYNYAGVITYVKEDRSSVEPSLFYTDAQAIDVDQDYFEFYFRLADGKTWSDVNEATFLLRSLAAIDPFAVSVTDAVNNSWNYYPPGAKETSPGSYGYLELGRDIHLTYQNSDVPTVFPAVYDGVEYQTLQRAVDAAAASGEKAVVSLRADVTECVSVPGGVDLTLDFGEYTLTGDGSAPALTLHGAALGQEGSVTLTGTKGGVDGGGKTGVDVPKEKNLAVNVTVEGGSYGGSPYALSYSTNAVTVALTLSGGHFLSNLSLMAQKVSITGGVYEGQLESALTLEVIEGGRYRQIPAVDEYGGGLAPRPPYVFSPQPDSEGYYTLRNNQVASILSEYFTSLQDAIDQAAKNTGENARTVKLLIDTTEHVTIPAGSAITLDLNGHELLEEADSKAFAIVNNGNLTLRGGGRVTGQGELNRTLQCGANSVTTIYDATFTHEIGLRLEANAVLNLREGAKIVNNATTSRYSNACAIYLYGGGSVLNLYDGAEITSNRYCVYNNNSAQTTVNMYGGRIFCADSFPNSWGACIYLQSIAAAPSSFNLYGGELECRLPADNAGSYWPNTVALYGDGGVLNLCGGHIIAVNEHTDGTGEIQAVYVNSAGTLNADPSAAPDGAALDPLVIDVTRGVGVQGGPRSTLLVKDAEINVVGTGTANNTLGAGVVCTWYNSAETLTLDGVTINVTQDPDSSPNTEEDGCYNGTGLYGIYQEFNGNTSGNGITVRSSEINVTGENAIGIYTRCRTDIDNSRVVVGGSDSTRSCAIYANGYTIVDRANALVRIGGGSYIRNDGENGWNTNGIVSWDIGFDLTDCSVSSYDGRGMWWQEEAEGSYSYYDYDTSSNRTIPVSFLDDVLRVGPGAQLTGWYGIMTNGGNPATIHMDGGTVRGCSGNYSVPICVWGNQVRMKLDSGKFVMSTRNRLPGVIWDSESAYFDETNLSDYGLYLDLTPGKALSVVAVDGDTKTYEILVPGEYSVELVTDRESYDVGDTVSVSIRASEDLKGKPLSSMQFTLNFDSATYELLPLSFASAIDGTGRLSEDGRTLVFSPDPEKIPAGTELAHFKLKVIGAGSAAIGLDYAEVTIAGMFPENELDGEHVTPAAPELTGEVRILGVADGEGYSVGEFVNLSEEGKAKLGADVSFRLSPEHGYDVLVTYQVGQDSANNSLTPEDGVYTIPKSALTGAVTVSFEPLHYYTVTFLPGTGVDMAEATAYTGGSSFLYASVQALRDKGEPDFVLPTPTARDGYRLAADDGAEPLWSDGTSFYQSSAIGRSVSYEADTVLTARAVKQWVITYAASGHAALEGDTAVTADEGSALSSFAKPKVVPDFGYEFSEWAQEPEGDTLTQDVTFTARIVPKTFPVSLPEIEGVSFTLEGTDDAGRAVYDTDLTLTMTADPDAVLVTGYQLSIGAEIFDEATDPDGFAEKSWTIPGGRLTGQVSLELESFAAIQITVAVGEHGSVTGTPLVVYRDVQGNYTFTGTEFTVLPERGYVVDENELPEAGAVISENKTYRVTFRDAQYSVTSNCGAEETATHGTDFCFTPALEGTLVTSVTVTIDGQAYQPTLSGKTYTIPGADILGEIVITAEGLPLSWELISADDYAGILADSQVAVLRVEGEDLSLALDGYDDLLWSEHYGAFVYIVDSGETQQSLTEKLSLSPNARRSLSYDGDLSGNGRVTAADSAPINDLLHQVQIRYTLDVKQRLEMDVTGEGSVSTQDILWILQKAVGQVPTASGTVDESEEEEP